MANKINDRKYNKLLNYRNNYYLGGGPVNRVYITPFEGGLAGGSDLNSSYDFNRTPIQSNISSGTSTENITKKPGLFGNLGDAVKDGFQSGALNSAATAMGGIVGSAIDEGMSSGAGDTIGSLGNIASAIPGPWGAVAGAGLKVVGGLTNRMFGSKLNKENINAVEGNINRLNNFQSNASSFDTLADTWGSTAFGTDFSNSYIGKDGWFSNKAKNKAKTLREKMQLANALAENTLQNNADNITENTMNNLEANYAAFGGELNTNGANFPTGLMLIGEGGTHESNPYEGVPMGVDPNGNPNLVEEGEAIYNDYVFSNRLTVPKAVKSKYKLRGTNDLTFAGAAKQLSKYTSERPNDPISQETLHEIMSDLMQTQEGVRNKNNIGNKFDEGGSINNQQTLKNSNENLRYAPAIGLGMTTLSDTLGLTNKPDYSEAAMIDAATRGGSYTPVSWNPIGNKLSYRPFDRDYYINKFNAETGASRRAIANQSGGNSGRAIAGLLASDYNSLGQLGDLFRKSEEYNLEQRQKVEDFNRATNQINSQGQLQADMANQQAYANARDFNLKGVMASAEMRQKARMAAEAARSANLSNFLSTLGDIGYENKGMNMIRQLYATGVFGPMYRAQAEGFNLIKKESNKKSKKGLTIK